MISTWVAALVAWTNGKKEFSVSPPYFDFIELCKIEKLDRKRKFCLFLETRLPRYNSILYKTNHFTICCFAKKIHHNKLKAMIHEKCPLRESPIFRDIPSDIMSLEQISHPWNSTDDTPAFTIIHTHIIIM